MARFTCRVRRTVVHEATIVVHAADSNEAWDRAKDEALRGVEWEQVEDAERPLGVEVVDVEEEK